MVPSQQAILIAVQRTGMSDADVYSSLDELAQLVAGLGISVCHRCVQKRAANAATTYLGEGKLKEIAAITGGPGKVERIASIPSQEGRMETSAYLIVADDELTAAQARSLARALAAEVLDRTAIILRLFETRARTKEARLQIELARLEYELPRIRDDHALGDREGGGGRASRGHTNVALAKQRSRERMAAIRREIEHVEQVRDGQTHARRDAYRVALVGYTNAGKSSLMRLLTGSQVLVEDKLFATLGTTTRPLMPQVTPPILITDTVGFVHRLPHSLVASFRSTLAEAREADLLLHLVDVSNPQWRLQYEVTTQVLAEMELTKSPTLLIFNKVDRLDAETRAELMAQWPDAMPMSALAVGDGMASRKRILELRASQLEEDCLSIPYDKVHVFGELRSEVQVVHEEYGEAVIVRLRAEPAVLARLKSRLAR